MSSAIRISESPAYIAATDEMFAMHDREMAAEEQEKDAALRRVTSASRHYARYGLAKFNGACPLKGYNAALQLARNWGCSETEITEASSR